MSKDEMRKMIQSETSNFLKKGKRVKVLKAEVNKTINIKAKRAADPTIDPNTNLRVSGWMRKSSRVA